jgi:hypothetical protein
MFSNKHSGSHGEDEGLKWRENPFPTSPAGTAELSPGRSPGLDLQGRQVPQGRLKIGRDAILENLQPSLRDSIMLPDVPRTTSWAKFSRPSGTWSRYPATVAVFSEVMLVAARASWPQVL